MFLKENLHYISRLDFQNCINCVAEVLEHPLLPSVHVPQSVAACRVCMCYHHWLTTDVLRIIVLGSVSQDFPVVIYFLHNG